GRLESDPGFEGGEPFRQFFSGSCRGDSPHLGWGRSKGRLQGRYSGVGFEVLAQDLDHFDGPRAGLGNRYVLRVDGWPLLHGLPTGSEKVENNEDQEGQP